MLTAAREAPGREASNHAWGSSNRGLFGVETAFLSRRGLWWHDHRVAVPETPQDWTTSPALRRLAQAFHFRSARRRGNSHRNRRPEGLR
jgi:hypothetical protein